MKYLKAENLFLVTAVGLFLAGLLPSVKHFDVNMHDTYFVIAGRHLLYLLSLFLLLISSVYFLFSKILRPLNFTSGIIHYILTMVFFVSFWQTADVSYSYNNSNSFLRSVMLLYITSVLLVIAQLLFVVNMVWTLLKPKVSKL